LGRTDDPSRTYQTSSQSAEDPHPPDAKPGTSFRDVALDAVTDTSTQPDTAQTLLAEAKFWPLLVAENFDSVEKSANSFQNFNTGDKISTTIGNISSGVLRLSVKSNKNGSFNHFLANQSATADDFYLKVDVRNIQGPGKGDARLVFLYNRNSGLSRYYTFGVRQGRYTLSMHAESWNSLRPWADPLRLQKNGFADPQIVGFEDRPGSFELTGIVRGHQPDDDVGVERDHRRSRAPRAIASSISSRLREGPL